MKEQKLTEKEKRELRRHQQKKLLRRLLDKIYQEDSSLYYASTSLIAEKLKELTERSAFPVKERELLSDLERGDIQILLGLSDKS